MTAIRDWPAAERPRVKLLTRGPAELSDADYGATTDITLRILDEEGEVVDDQGVDPNGGEVTVSGAGEYTMELLPGLSDPDRGDPVPFTLVEDYFVARPAALRGRAEEASDLALYPGLGVEVEVVVDGTLPAADGFEAAGELVFQDQDGARWLVLPLRIP